MKNENKKCVMIISKDLSAGAAANTSAVLGIAVGAKLPGIIGDGVRDRDGNLHSGTVSIPIPVLKGDSKVLNCLNDRLREPLFSDVVYAGFPDFARQCKTYGEYTEKMSAVSASELNYIGIAIFGDKKKINKLTGNLPLL